MQNDVWDVPVIFYHFLMVASALISCATPNGLRHKDVNLHTLSLRARSVK